MLKRKLHPRASCSTVDRIAIKPITARAVVKITERVVKLDEQVKWLSFHIAACNDVISRQDNADILFKEIEKEYHRIELNAIKFMNKEDI